MALPPEEIGRRIREVRTEVGVSVDTLAGLLGIDSRVVDRLEAGQLKPIPGDYILLIARRLGADFRYFMSSELDDVEEKTERLFRAMSNPAPEDLFAIRRFMAFCLNEADLEKLLGERPEANPPSYPKSGSRRRHVDQGRDAARQERIRLRLGNNPVRNVFELVRREGVRLFRRTLEDSTLSGVTVLHPRAGICVLVNYYEDLYRQLFSAAHEYGHVLFDRDELDRQGGLVSYQGKKDLREIRSNSFAAEFLLPIQAMSAYARPDDDESFEQAVRSIATDYGVNGITVAIRAKECGWITEETLAAFKERRPVVIRKSEKHDPDLPKDLTPKQEARWKAVMSAGISRRYLDLLRRARSSDLITAGRFAEMLDMTPDEATAFVEASGLAI